MFDIALLRKIKDDLSRKHDFASDRKTLPKK